MNDHSKPYFEANRKNWDERAGIHAASKTYALDVFRTDPDFISGVVEFDEPYLGNLDGVETVHLQCHIGSDTLSLARLGATVTGLDQSAASLEVARKLFEDTNTTGHFALGNVYDAPAILGRQYDLVYTSVGALNWLPSIELWAAVVEALLAPGGRLYLREGHPMLFALADSTDGSLQLGYPYFETAEPMVFDETVSYTEEPVTISETRTYEWNHGLGEVIMSLLNRGLVLDRLDEHDGLEWEMFPHMVIDDEQYKLPPEQRDMVPMMYTLMAHKPER